jgi:predicted amidohydrolase YtcJ
VQEEAGRLLMNAQSADEVRDAILSYANANPGDGWIRAEKYALTAFPGGKTNRQFLDSIILDRPVLLYDDTLHNAVANSKALEIAGITSETPDPDNGTIDRHPVTHEPTGYLAEGAIALVGRHTPPLGVNATQRAIERAFVEFRALGITSFVDMFAYTDSLLAYKKIEEKGGMTFRVSAAVALNDYTDEFDSLEGVAYVAGLAANVERGEEFSPALLEVDSFKYWIDGTPVTYTALLIKPYANRDTTGRITTTDAQLNRAAQLLEEGKLIGRFHNAGDGTTRLMLDLVEKSRAANPQNNRPVHFGHNFAVHPDDFSRFVDLDVIAEFSPHLWFPGPNTKVAGQFLGQKRMDAWMPIADMHESGVTVAIGSDWPAGTPTADPLRGLEAAVTRRNPDPGSEYEGQLGKRVPLEDAIAMMTLNATKLMERENEIGSIEVGKYADMVVLDQNLFEITPDSISDTKVMKTIFNGKLVYEVGRDPGPTTRQARVLMPLSKYALAHLGSCAHEAHALRRFK